MASRNNINAKMCLFSRLLRWFFVIVVVSHWQKKQTIFVSAVLETAAVDVYLDSEKNDAPSYTMLVSQALFGSYPKMNPENNPARAVHTPPEDNPLLCNPPTTGDARWKPQEGTTTQPQEGFAMMVPRGNCTFEIKAYHAQLMGASAMVLYGTLASRYSLNTTGRPSDHPYTDRSDVIYPVDKYDYDCDMGRASIPVSALDMNPHGIDMPYNASYNDPKLSGGGNDNLCMQNSPDHLSKCPSKACLLTGKVDEFDKAEACCAWDLHIWLYPDAQFELNHTTATNQSSSSSSAATTTPDAPPLVTIPSFYVTMAQGHKLLNDLENAMPGTMRVILYARWRSAYNWSSALVWLLGVCTAAVAAYLSAHDLHALNRKLMAPRGSSSSLEQDQRGNASRPRRVAVATPVAPAEEMELTVWHALIFVVMASTSLMVLFYFKIYNAVKVGYAVGCSKAVSQVFLDPILKRVMRRCCNVRNDQVVLRTDDFGDITVRDIISHALAYAWGLAWICFAFFVLHPERYAFFWITQDVFGVAMCILFLQVIKVNCVRVAAVLLSVAFFYDIFFVFITPLLARDGKSVMITVATSGGPPAADAAWCEKYPRDPNCAGGDPLPMLLTVPRLEDYQGGASLLGLGDVVLPGLLLAFCARYDAAKRLMALLGGGGGRGGGGQPGAGSSSGGSTYHECPEERFLCASTVTCCSVCCCRAGYFWPVAMAYGAGLAMANVAVYVMNYGQPALLYLVPACLGTVCCLAHRRGEWTDLWRGPKILKTADKVVNGRRGRRIMMNDGNDDIGNGNGVIMEDEEDDDDDNEAETTTQQHDNHERIPMEDGMQAPSVPSAVRQQQQQQQYQEGAAVDMEILEDTKR